MKKEKIEAEVEIKSKGLGKLRAEWLDMAGDLAEPMILLAAGATKAEAAWAGFKGIIHGRVLGPLGLVAGAATAFLVTTNSLIGKWREMGMSGAASLEAMQLRFKPLLGSIEAAKMRVKELVTFTEKTPFRLGESAEANQLLETLTRGALSTKEGMTLVGDAAVVAGESFASTARQVGRLYDGLESGRPVGEASMRLQELGLISGETRNQIESMQKSNTSGSAIWKVVEADLKRNVGAMDDLSISIQGLDSTIEDVRESMQAGFSSGFLEGEKAGMEASIKTMEKMAPVANYLGQIVGSVSNKWEVFKGRVVETVTSIPGLTSAIKFAAVGIVGLSAAITLATGAMAGRFLVSILSATAANKALVASTGNASKAMVVQTGVVKLLTAAKVNLVGALTAVRAGSYAVAMGHLKVAATSSIAAIKTNGYAASVMILRGALKILAVSVKFVLVQLRFMAVALLANPVFLAAAAIIALGAAFLHFQNKAKQAREALEAYQKAAENLNDTLDRQRRSLKTLNDLRKHEAEVMRNLIKAHKEEDQYRKSGQQGMLNASKKKISALESQLVKLREVSSAQLQISESEQQLSQFLGEGKKGAAKLRREADSNTPELQAELANFDFEGRKQKKRTEEDAIAEEKIAQERIRDNERKRQDVLLQIGKQSLVVSQKEGAYNQTTNGRGSLLGNSEEKIAKYKKELSDAREKLQKLQMKETVLGTGLVEKLNSGSEKDNLEAKISLTNSLASSLADLERAEKAVVDAQKDGAKKPKLDKLKSTVRQVENTYKVLKGLDKKYGFDGSPRSIQRAKSRIEEIKKNRKENLDPEKLEAARLKMEEKKRALQDRSDTSRLNAEQSIASVKFKGVRAEVETLKIAYEKVRLARQQGKITRDEAADQIKVLEARRMALKERLSEMRKAANQDLQIRQLDRKRKGALDSGDQEKAKSLQKEIDSRLDAKSEVAFRKEAEKLFTGKKAIDRFVRERLGENRLAREQQRLIEDRDAKNSRNQSRFDVVKAESSLNVGVLQALGKTQKAKDLEEATARKQDSLDKKKFKENFIKQGFSNEEATSLADRQVKVNESGRLLDKLREQGTGTTVADSLASVGGGGNASGVDPNTAILEKIERLVQSIDHNSEGLDMTIK